MLRPGQVIAACVLCLLTLGVVMVASATMQVGRGTTIEGILLNRSTAYMALALLAMFIAAHAPLRRLVSGHGHDGVPVRDHRRGITSFVLPTRANLDRFGGWVIGPMWVAAAVFIAVIMLVYVPGLGREVNGSSRWLSLPIPGVRELSVQPSEIAKWGLIGVVAWYAWVMRSRLGSFVFGLLPILACVGIVTLVIVKEDLGTAVLIGAVAAIMLMAGGAKLWHFGVMLPIGIAGFVAAVYASPYRLERIKAFIDPFKDPQGRGYHGIQSMGAVSNGHVFGTGLGNGLSKFGYLPEDQTDFIFAIICEELGLFGAGLVALLYGGLVWAAWMIVRKQENAMLRLIGLGVTATVGLQAVINMAVVTGLGPTKGIALPLISSGGTGWILTAASLGLLIGMDRVTRSMPAPILNAEGDAIVEVKPATEPAAA